MKHELCSNDIFKLENLSLYGTVRIVNKGDENRKECYCICDICIDKRIIGDDSHNGTTRKSQNSRCVTAAIWLIYGFYWKIDM